jgi:protein-arginine kinase activator protein McsA
MQNEEPEEEETAEERRNRWIARESAKADSKTVRCSKCGKEVKEFADRAGRILCLDCYIEEEMAEGESMPDISGGAG